MLQIIFDDIDWSRTTHCCLYQGHALQLSAGGVWAWWNKKVRWLQTCKQCLALFGIEYAKNGERSLVRIYYEAQYEGGMLNHKIFLYTLFQTLTVTHRLHVCLVSWIVAPMANWNIFYFLNFLSIVLSRQRSTIEGNFDISGEIYFLSTGHRWGGKIDQWWLNFLVLITLYLAFNNLPWT